MARAKGSAARRSRKALDDPDRETTGQAISPEVAFIAASLPRQANQRHIAKLTASTLAVPFDGKGCTKSRDSNED